MATKIDTVIKDLSQFERVLGELGDDERGLKSITDDYQIQIKGLKLKQESDTCLLKTKVIAQMSDLVMYVRAYPESFRNGNSKSMEFVTGSVHTKNVEKFSYPEDDELLDALRDKYPELVDAVVNAKETVAKSVLKKWLKKNPDAMLPLGVQLNNELEITIKPV